MKICHACEKELKLNLPIGRSEVCPYCSADLHCCLNCTFYDTGYYNSCRETQAERVVDKGKSNFCDYFLFRDTPGLMASPSVKEKWASLFKK